MLVCYCFGNQVITPPRLRFRSLGENRCVRRLAGRGRSSIDESARSENAELKGINYHCSFLSCRKLFGKEVWQ